LVTERRLAYDRDDFKRILERKKLSPFGVHVFVEGRSDQELIGGLIDAIWGDHRRLGVRFTPLGGLGEVARQATLFEMFSSYARKALLVADDEGKIERDLKRLRTAGLLVADDESTAGSGTSRRTTHRLASWSTLRKRSPPLRVPRSS
jgi:hypothetical protein